MEKCPFLDPEFEMLLDEPCPICGATGRLGDWINTEAIELCEKASKVIDDEE